MTQNILRNTIIHQIYQIVLFVIYVGDQLQFRSYIDINVVIYVIRIV
jgi:hypothetical protein